MSKDNQGQGWGTIPARVFAMDDPGAELYPRLTRGGDRRSEDFKRNEIPFENFAENAAKRIKRTVRMVNDYIKLATDLDAEAQEDLKGSPIENRKSELTRLAKQLKAGEITRVPRPPKSKPPKSKPPEPEPPETKRGGAPGKKGGKGGKKQRSKTEDSSVLPFAEDAEAGRARQAQNCKRHFVACRRPCETTR